MLTYNPHALANLNPELLPRQMLLELGTSSGVLPRPCPGDSHSECLGSWFRFLDVALWFRPVLKQGMATAFCDVDVLS